MSASTSEVPFLSIDGETVREIISDQSETGLILSYASYVSKVYLRFQIVVYFSIVTLTQKNDGARVKDLHPNNVFNSNDAVVF